MHRFFAYQLERVLRALERIRPRLIEEQHQRRDTRPLQEKAGFDLPIDWNAEEQALRAAIGPLIADIVGDALENARRHWRALGVRTSWEVWDRAAADMARRYRFDLIKDLNESTRRQLGRAVAEWIESEDAFPALVKKVRRILPARKPPGTVRDRAQLIATTEVTRIYADSRLAGMQAAGLRRMRWRTAEDELVCPLCGPLGAADGGRGAVGDAAAGRFVDPVTGRAVRPPPRHPGCRCWVAEDPDELRDLLKTAPAEDAERRPSSAETFPFRIEELQRDTSVRLSGAHSKEVYIAPDGSRWLFKPQDEFRAVGDKVAYDLARALGLPAAETYVVRIGGRLGSIQRMFDVRSTLRGVAPAALTEEQIIRIQKEHIFDWLIGNHDGHAENLLVTVDGKIVGIDKGQLFKFYDRDRLDWDYNPNARFGVVSYHNELLRRWVRGEGVFYASYDHPELAKFLERIQRLSDAEFVRIIRPYAEAAYKFQVAPGRRALAYQDIDTFLQRAIERKNRIGDDFRELYSRALQERERALARLVERPITPLDDAFVREVEAAGWQGKALLFGGEDVEDMYALVYRVDGDGTLVDLKLRKQADKKLIARLGNLADGSFVVTDPDPYWGDVLKVVKSYNYHLKPDSPGYDGTVPVHTRDKIRQLWNKLRGAAADDPVADYYMKAIIDDLYAEVVLDIRPKGHVIGKMIKPYEPPRPRRRRLEGSRRRPRANKVPAQLYRVRNEQGRVVWEEGQSHRFDGNGVMIELDHDMRAQYIFHADGNGRIYSKQGRMMIQIDGDLTPEKLERMRRRLGELGVETRLATREDMEYLYLVKTANAVGVDEDGLDALGITPDMPIRERIERLLGFWNERLGVGDVRKLPGYDPMPRFESPAPTTGRKRGAFGPPRWRRFDITEEDLDRTLPDHVLVHKITAGGGDTLGTLRLIFEHNGALLATEEKYRVGIPIAGWSPTQDQRTGGASYVFTRLRGPRQARSWEYHLLFDKRLLLDPDVIVYNGDYYGNVHPDHIRSYRQRFLADWKATAKYASNEVLIKRRLSLWEYLVGVNARNERERRQIIEFFRSLGFEKLGGRPLEEAIQVVR